MKKNVIFIAPDGTTAMNLTETPASDDMIVTSEAFKRSGDGRNMDKLTIDAPAIGELSTKEQRDAVNRLVADWLGKRAKLIGKTVDEKARVTTDIREEKDTDDKTKVYKIPFISVEVPYGKLSSDQIVEIGERILKWLEATGKKADTKKSDDKKGGTNPGGTKKPDPKKGGTKKPDPKKGGTNPGGTKKPDPKKGGTKPAPKKPASPEDLLSAEDLAILNKFMPED